MGTNKGKEILPPEWSDRFQKLSEIIAQLQQENSALKSRPQSGENITFAYLRLFRQFLLDAQANNWLIKRKYETKNSENYIDIDFGKYTDFLRNNLEDKEHRKFREFLLALNLINPDTFTGKYGKIVTGAGEDRKRLFRVTKEVFFWFTQDMTDIAS